MPDLQETVMDYPKIIELLQEQDETGDGKNSKEIREEVLQNLDAIRSEYSESATNKVKKILDPILGRLYDDLSFSDNGVDLKTMVAEKNVILVPNHQSHLDYLVVNYAFYKKYHRPLFVAGGDNLNIFPIGKLFRSTGCFFIRRSFSKDKLYKLTLEAYLYALLKGGHPIEFFFEGGRSRTGKLLPPRFGLFQMILEAHSQIPAEIRRELIFVPVSIMHEFVPEQRQMSRELDGQPKKKESFSELLKVFKVLNKKFGTVYIHVGRPVPVDWDASSDKRKFVYDLAFECFRRVGANMRVTPMSLLSLILLDDPKGAIRWDQCLKQAQLIRDYCLQFKVPMTDSLLSDDYVGSLQRALDILRVNDKVSLVGKKESGTAYYILKDEARSHMLYFKNSILQHFIVPWTICSAWINLFNGSINDSSDLKRLFFAQRRQLKHEFYLPKVKELILKSIEVMSYSVGYEVKDLKEFLELKPKDLYAMVSSIGVFSQTLSYINAAYYVSAHALRLLVSKEQLVFDFEIFKAAFIEVYQHEKKLGAIVRHPESCSIPLMKSTLKYFVHTEVISFNEEAERYQIESQEEFGELIQRYDSVLEDQLSFQIRV